MSYAKFGPRLVERGYSAVPCLPGQKIPGHLWRGHPAKLDAWTRYKSCLPSEEDVERWCELPETFGVCLVMGFGQVAIDIDAHEPEIVAAVNAVLGDTPVVKVGRKGETSFFLGPDVESRSFDEYARDASKPSGWRAVRRLVDIIGPGRQTVLPPTIHPDTGLPYRWTGFVPLDAIDPAELPLLAPDIGDRIGEALRPYGWQPSAEMAPRSTVVRSASGEPFRDLNDAALADLGAWVPKLGLYKLKARGRGFACVATWRASSTGRPLEKREPNVKISPDGIVDFHDGDKRYTPVNLVMEAEGVDHGEAFMRLSHWLGRVPEMVAHDITTPTRETVVADGHLIDTDTGEILDEAPKERAAEDFPEGELRYVGLVEDLANWICRTSPKPIRLFAYGAALSIVGTLLGRRVYAHGIGTALFQIIIAGTGGGKERPQEAIRFVLDAVTERCKAQRMHSAETASAASLGVSITARPCCVQVIDEMDRILKKVGNRNASSQESELLQAYNQVWGKNKNSYTPTSTTTRSDAYVKRPSLGIFSATTPDSFFKYMRAEMLSNGFLNRFVVFRKFKRKGFAEYIHIDEEVPEELMAQLVPLFEIQPKDGPRNKDLGALYVIQDSNVAPESLDVPIAEDAQAIIRDCRIEQEDMIALAEDEENPRPNKLAWTRFAENTQRIALILACGRFAKRGLHGVEVSADDVRFAKRLVAWSCESFEIELDARLSESEPQANAKEILRRITKSGKDGLSRAKLCKVLDHKLHARDLDGAIKSLIESGQVIIMPHDKTKGGRPATIYKAL